MVNCRVCGESEDQHHDFDPQEAPDGCQCDVKEWGFADAVGPICDSHKGNVTMNCAECEHDEACHVRKD